MRSAAGSVGALALIIVAGCASSPEVKPYRLAADRLEVVAEKHAGNGIFALRLNPARCDVPLFEVRLDGVDYRVFLEPTGPDGLPAQLQARLEAEAAQGNEAASATVRGVLSDGVRVTSTRAWCLELKVLSICEPEGCPVIE